jgi:anaerobic dimethyl sulfoxide reductase subunit B (iron-sulfur subunit)
MKMAKQLAFYFNSSTCTDCKACQIACKDKNDLPIGVLWRRVIQYEGGSWIQNGNTLVPSNVFSYSVSTSCQHCESPVCLEVCPTAAITKGLDGIVSIDQQKCIGCRYCQWACPYGAPQFNEDKSVMTKCTFCADYLAEGKAPACVDACVMRALEFGELDELRAKYGNLNAVEPLPVGDLTHPSLVITPHKDTQLSGTGTGRISNLPEEL